MYEDKKKILDDFRKVWGDIDKVKNMTIDDYCGYNNEDSFIRWVEWKTRDLGSISGAYAIKVGIYEMSPGHEKPKSSKYRSDDKYMWVSTLNDVGITTAENAFEWVKKYIIQIINAVETGHLEDIDNVDTLWRGYKYKVAFLYQEVFGRKVEILPVFNREHLSKFLGLSDEGSLLSLYKKAISEYKITSIDDAYSFMENVYGISPKDYTSHIKEVKNIQDYSEPSTDESIDESIHAQDKLDEQNAKHGGESEEERKVKQYELDLQEKLKPTKIPFRFFSVIALLTGIVLLVLEIIAVIYKTSDGFRIGQFFWLFWTLICAFMWCFYDIMIWANSHLRDWIRNKKNKE